jgi:hypothetical protein
MLALANQHNGLGWDLVLLIDSIAKLKFIKGQQETQGVPSFCEC